VVWITEFGSLDDLVLGAEGADDEVVAGDMDGLVVAGVHAEVAGEFMADVCGGAALGMGVFGEEALAGDLFEARAGGEFDGMRFNDGAVWGVFNGCADLGGYVLDEGSTAPDV